MKKIKKIIKEKKKKRKYLKIKYAKELTKIKKKKNNNIHYFIFLTKFLIIIFLSILNHKISYPQNIYKYNFNFTKEIDNLTSKSFESNDDKLFQGLYIESTENTLNEIIKYKKSISRFSDGEFFIIDGRGIRFQEYNKNLSKRLLEIINNNNIEDNLLVGIDFPYKKKELDLYIDYEVKYWTNFFSENKFKLLKILNKNKKYYSSDITRFYFKFKDKSNVPKHIAKLKKIWEGRDILIVEGEKSRVGIGNDLLNNTKSIKRIICPAKHAFRVYNKILDAVLKVSKDNLILIALGPTASVLAYDLSKLGYQAVDFGHTDIEYELFLRNATEMIQIPYKFVNEFNEGRNEDVGNVTDINYYNQIIYKILY